MHLSSSVGIFKLSYDIIVRTLLWQSVWVTANTITSEKTKLKPEMKVATSLYTKEPDTLLIAPCIPVRSKQTRPKNAWVILQSFNRKKTRKEIWSFPVCFMIDTNIFPSGSTAWRKLTEIIIWSFWRKLCPKLCSHYAKTWLVWWRMGIFVKKSVHIRQNIGRIRVDTWLSWAWLKQTREVVSIMIRSNTFKMADLCGEEASAAMVRRTRTPQVLEK